MDCKVPACRGAAGIRSIDLVLQMQVMIKLLDDFSKLLSG
jgi:hypothetical protein